MTFIFSNHLSMSTCLLKVVSQVSNATLNQLSWFIKHDKLYSMDLVINQLIKVANIVQNANKLVGNELYLNLGLNTLFFIMLFCISVNKLTLTPPRYFSFINFFMFVIQVQIDLYLMCDTSQTIIDSMDSFYEASEQRLTEEGLTVDNQTRRRLIKELRRRVAFRGLNMYKISRRTYFYIVHICATFSIILIQTN